MGALCWHQLLLLSLLMMIMIRLATKNLGHQELSITDLQ
jgi:hypothetical protein